MAFQGRGDGENVLLYALHVAFAWAAFPGESEGGIFHDLLHHLVNAAVLTARPRSVFVEPVVKKFTRLGRIGSCVVSVHKVRGNEFSGPRATEASPLLPNGVFCWPHFWNLRYPDVQPFGLCGVGSSQFLARLRVCVVRIYRLKARGNSELSTPPLNSNCQRNCGFRHPRARRVQTKTARHPLAHLP